MTLIFTRTCTIYNNRPKKNVLKIKSVIKNNNNNKKRSCGCGK